MRERRMRWLGAILLMTLIAMLVGIGAYRMGMSQGLALGMAQVESGREAVHYGWHGPGYGWHGPWGYGYGFGFGPLVSLLFFFVAVAALRMLWRGPRGPWRRGWGGPGHGGFSGRGGPWGHRRHPRGRFRYDDRDDDGRSYEDDWHRRTSTL